MCLILMTKRMMLAGIRFITFTSILISASSVLADDSWAVFRNPDFNFLYPRDWKIKEPRSPTVRGKISSPQGKPTAACSVARFAAEGLRNRSQRDLDQLILSRPLTRDDWRDLLADDVLGANILETREVKVVNRPAHFVVFEGVFETVGGKMFMRAQQFMTLRPGYAWRFTCGAFGSNAAEARKYFTYWKPSIDQMMTSFMWEP